MNKKVQNDWQATEDAHTLERYQEIINDKARLSRAMKEAKNMANNLSQRASTLKRSLTGLKSK